MMMLRHATPHGRRSRIGVVHQRQRMLPPHPHPPIRHIQPIGHRRAGQEVRLVEKRSAVSEVVHLYS
jgi:hypothetical protein